MSIILNEKGAEWLKQLKPMPDQREFFAKRAAKLGIKSYNITRTTINSPQKPQSADNDHIKGEIKIMATVLDVARYILDHVGETSAWKLQKLCYYAQAWSIAWTEKPLFAEEFEAWRNGPVCPVLFRLHQGQFTVKPEDIPGHPEVLTADELETLTSSYAIMENGSHMNCANRHTVKHRGRTREGTFPLMLHVTP